MKVYHAVSAPLIFVCLLSAGCGLRSRSVEAAGPMVTENRAIASCDGIEVNAPLTVTVNIVPDAAPALSITAPQAAMAELVTRVGSDGTLSIRVADDVDLHSDKPMTATLTLPALRNIALTGSDDITVTGLVTANKLEATNTGSGNVRLASVDARRVTTRISGSGNITLSQGKADKMEATISGSGSLEAASFKVEDANIAISGAGNASVDAEDDLNATISGSGNIRYGNTGHPKVVQQISGSGSITPIR